MPKNPGIEAMTSTSIVESAVLLPAFADNAPNSSVRNWWKRASPKHHSATLATPVQRDCDGRAGWMKEHMGYQRREVFRNRSLKLLQQLVICPCTVEGVVIYEHHNCIRRLPIVRTTQPKKGSEIENLRIMNHNLYYHVSRHVIVSRHVMNNKMLFTVHCCCWYWLTVCHGPCPAHANKTSESESE